MSARVLVVDDVDINVKLLEAKLSSEYFDVLTASNGFVAIEKAQKEDPDIILLDIMMPKMDGFETCRRLKSDPRTAHIPVVMVTALSDASDRLRGLESGADDFLTKPVNDIALFARVRSLVRLKRMMDEWRLREDVYGSFSLMPSDPTAIPDGDMPGRILLLDDHALSISRMTETLRTIADPVISAPAVADAQLHASGGLIDLIIASMTIEGADILRFVSHLRAQETTRQVPILLTAEQSDLPRLAKGLDLGANDYLIRPIDRNELLARARTQIRRKRLQDGLRDNYQRSLSLALTDPLTGVYNRRYLQAHLDGLLKRSSENAGSSILMFDLDYFKTVNDTHGHLVGDEVLVEVARRALRNVRSFDLVARYGGEEFVIVMPNTPLSAATMVAERLRKAIADRPISAAGGTIEVHATISVGVAATSGITEDSPQVLLKRVDEALYRAKGDGRNKVMVVAGRDVPDGAAEPIASAG